MTRPDTNRDGSGWAGPVVEIWFDDKPDGSQSVFITGETSDGDRFFGSFFQPTLNDDQEDNRAR